ncbi:SGNH/GDSL hydrolase family protein [Hymenobacter antarcticus]|uniref:SGNH/GDSL hydrolase family protein n=1 Tax=Hymenobacter antarcticus TaxID=486270 RepID=A0ABP7P4V4_9BACT
MKPFFKYTAPALALLGLSLGSCKPDLEDSPKSNAGQADFSRFIAVGNSLTAGFGDNGLYLEGQQTSYPAIMGQQFAQVGGGAFVQPLFAAANANGTGYLSVTGFTAAGSPVLTPVAANAAVGLGADGRTPLLVKYTATDNQNLGIPGIRVADVQTPGYGFNNPLGFNPYFERLLGATNPVATYQQYVQERVATIRPTFFTNWLGNNDVLGYATSGGTAAPLTGDAEFTTKYTAITDALTAGGAKGLLATIPNVVNVPYFTTVPTASTIASVSAAPVPASTVAALTAALSLTPAQASSIRFGLFIQALSATGTVVTREATATDLLLLPASSVIGTPSTPANPFPRGFGLVITGLSPAQAAGLAGAAPANPLPNSLVLDVAEVALVQNRTTALNTIISNLANSKGLALFDSNTFFNGVARNGLVVNGVNNTASFISGNLFSLDGVHPTPRGYAVIANEMIRAINAKYGSAVPGVDPTTYRGVRFPN